MAQAVCNTFLFCTQNRYNCLLRCWRLHLRPRQDLVPVPGHCALAPKEMLFTHCGAQKHFLAVCIYDSNCFVDRLTAATSNHRETRVTKNMALMESCADKCPCPGGRCLNTTFGESARTRYCAQVFVRAPLKCYVHIGAHAQPRNQVWMWP